MDRRAAARLAAARFRVAVAPAGGARASAGDGRRHGRGARAGGRVRSRAPAVRAKIALFQAVRHQIADMGTQFTAAPPRVAVAITLRRKSETEQGTSASACTLRRPGMAPLLDESPPATAQGFVVEHRMRFHSERAQSLCIPLRARGRRRWRRSRRRCWTERDSSRRGGSGNADGVKAARDPRAADHRRQTSRARGVASGRRPRGAARSLRRAPACARGARSSARSRRAAARSTSARS